jgi:pantoate--beta-alanine ligase
MNEIQSQVLKVLVKALGVSERAVGQSANARLLGAIPQLDSMSVITVVMDLEREFGINIAEYEISASDFETLGALAAYVEKKLPARNQVLETIKSTDVAVRLNSIKIIRTCKGLREQLETWRQEGNRIGLVPTMGALHAGHMALIKASLSHCSKTIVSIYVNPGQFRPSSFTVYPRDEQADIELLESENVDLVFAPSTDEIYPDGFATGVSVQSFAHQFAPPDTPRYYDSVATIVTKLLSLSFPDYAFFGEKDYEQLVVVRRLVRDFGFASIIEAVPTLREADGLAMASSNRFLTHEERGNAPMLYAVLSRIASRFMQAGFRIEDEIQSGSESLLRAGFRKVDYLNIYDAETLRPVSTVTRPARVMAAAWLGRPRLIDNVPVFPRT